MAADPRLIDHSGNGHHATCYNFAWGWMSGIGGYVMSMSDFGLNGAPANITLSRTKASIHIELTDEFAGDYVIGCSTTNWDLTKDRTFCINSTYSQGFELSYYRSNVGVPAVDIPANGDVFVPANPDSDCKILYFNLNSIRGAGTIDIELLPAYPDALVSDGVDDYCLVEGLPILTKEKGYTVIAKRKWINEDLSGVTAFLSKASGNTGSDGAFMFEAKDSLATRKLCRSFGKDLILPEEGFHKSDITYQTSVKYNDKPMNTGSGIDTDKLSFFVFSNVADYKGRFVLYSTILFDRDLTTEEIEWVKTNLIETEQ